MFAALAFALITFNAPSQQAPCRTGEVLAVDRGHDYTLLEATARRGKVGVWAS